MKTTIKVLVILASVLLLSSGVTAVNDPTRNCATIYVDLGVLGDSSKSTMCIPIDKKTSALSLLSAAGYKIEGTEKYKDAIVCRVNGLPDASTEKCLDMPPENAYWAVIVKNKQVIPLPFGLGAPWGWAQTGINEVYLQPGDSIGLVFATDGEVTFP
jgi:hypothetical protein